MKKLKTNKVWLLNLPYLLLELAVARRRSSMKEEEEEDGNTPRFIRHCKPLRSPNRRLSGADPGEAASELKDGTDEDSGNGGSIWAGGMIIRQPLTYPDAQNQRYSRKKKCELCRKINENCPNFWSGAPKKRNNLTELQSGKAKNWKFSATQGSN